MSEWKEYKLGEIINVKHGYAFKGEYFSDIQTLDILLTPGNFNIGGGFKKGKLKYYNGDYPISYVLSEGDIVVTMTDLSKEGDTLGYSAKIPKHKDIRYLHNQRIGLLQFTNKDFCKDFIYWILRSRDYQKFIVNSATGSTVKHTSPSRICEYVFFAPDLPTQTAIAEILSSLDDKIELNNKINKELENLAQTLFKRWFIDFEFPNENGEPYKSSGGEIVESELGEIPKGWEVKTLKDEFILNMGQSPNGDTYNTIGDGMIFFQGRSDFGFRFPSIRMYTNDPKKIAKKFETLISVRAPVGDINMASEDCCIGRGLGSISHIFKLYSYTYYKILSIQVELKSYDNEGTVFGSINKETLGNIKSIIPPIDICKSFNDLSVANDGLIFNMVNECQQLTNLRDTLLPKLISGELEVNNINF
jgi:type I restriction enzyme S subunit